MLLGIGGLGLGVNFSAIIAHISTAVPRGYAPDVSGVSSTTAAIGGTLGVAIFATLYLGLGPTGADAATRAFAIVTAALTAAALMAALAARRATRPPVTPAVHSYAAELHEKGLESPASRSPDDPANQEACSVGR